MVSALPFGPDGQGSIPVEARRYFYEQHRRQKRRVASKKIDGALRISEKGRENSTSKTREGESASTNSTQERGQEEAEGALAKYGSRGTHIQHVARQAGRTQEQHPRPAVSDQPEKSRWSMYGRVLEADRQRRKARASNLW